MIEVPVTIIGGGVVGLALALRLEQAGISSIVLEKKFETSLHEKPHAYHQRCVALNETSIDLLKSLQVWDEQIAPFAAEYQKMDVWDIHSVASIQFDNHRQQANSLGAIVPIQPIRWYLQTALFNSAACECLEGDDIVDIEQGHSHRTLRLKSGRTIQTQLLISAAGARSSLREYFKVDMKTWSYEQTAIVCTLHIPAADSQTAYQQFQGKQGPIACLPLAKTGWFSLVWSLSNEEASAKMQLSDQQFTAALNQARRNRLGAIEVISARKSFPLVMRQAKKYYQPGFALIGDSAHTVHPLAGLGMNLGLKDVTVLCDFLKKSVQLKRSLSDELALKRYHQVRQPAVWETILFLEAIKQGFIRQNALVKKCRELAFGVADSQGWLKERLLRSAAQL